MVLAGLETRSRARERGLLVLAGPETRSRARERGLLVLAGPKTPLRARETPSGCLGGIGGGENLRRRRSKLLDDGFGGALGEDEGGDEVGDETASAAEYEDYPGQSDNDGIDVKVVGNSYADAQNLAAFLFTVEFLVHISNYWL